MNFILAILGSSAFGAIISFLFTWLTNQKNNSLNYITDERRKWRKKIREVVNGIEKSKFQGKESNDISQYLSVLQVNINPYGKKRKKDYEKDGHIWDIIEKINNSKTESEFIKDKGILLEYLSLMLKKDWERSKSEVRGYSKIVVYVGVVLLDFLIYMVYYFYILKLESVPFLLLMLFINLIPLFYIKYFLVDEIDAIENDRKRMPIKLMIKKEKKIKKSTIKSTLCILFVLIFNILIGMYYYPKVMSENMMYCKENDTIYLYTNLELNVVGNLEGILRQNVKDKVIIVKTKSELPVKQERQEENDAILVKAIQNTIYFWNVFITVLAGCIPFIGIFLSKNPDIETRKYVAEIDRINYMANCQYNVAYEQILVFIERINFTSKKYSKENDIYLGLIYSLLIEIEKNLKSIIFEKEKSIESVNEYDKLSEKKDKLEEIRITMERIKKINKKVRLKRKRELLPNLKEKIKKINLEKFQME